MKVTHRMDKKLANQTRLEAKPWLECAGELAHLRKETKRIQRLIEEEFEKIEPEDWK